MLPKADHVNPLLLETGARSLVTCAVPFDLCLPKSSVRSRQMTAPWAAMPEATIHKHRKLSDCKEEIGASVKPLGPDFPSLHTSLNQPEPQAPFCRSVVLSTDRLHRLRPLRARPLEFPIEQVGFQRMFHSLNALVVEGGHRRGKPEQLFFREVIANPNRETVPRELQLCKCSRQFLQPQIDPCFHVRINHSCRKGLGKRKEYFQKHERCR